jgi:hypothetical protein
MASFERLFKLAKNTGDRLIVFDSATGDGFAAIPIDEYETLILGEQEWESDDQYKNSWIDDSNSFDIETQAEVERDMELWRAGFDAAEAVFRADEIENLTEPQLQDSFEEDISDEPDWQSAADVLNDRYVFDNDDLIVEDDEDDIITDTPLRSSEDEDGVYVDKSDISFDFPAEEDETEEPHVEDLPFPIPPLETPVEGTWKEEPLDEDPVFFEEPV